MEWLLLALFTKHLIFDFLYQPPYQWMNKGTYGHPGGIIHSGVHALATYFLLLFVLSPLEAAGIALLEFLIHYHMDWFKMWYNKKKGWLCNKHEQFWQFLGIDQYVHALTYIGITAYVV